MPPSLIPTSLRLCYQPLNLYTAHHRSSLRFPIRLSLACRLRFGLHQLIARRIARRLRAASALIVRFRLLRFICSNHKPRSHFSILSISHFRLFYHFFFLFCHFFHIYLYFNGL